MFDQEGLLFYRCCQKFTFGLSVCLLGGLPNHGCHQLSLLVTHTNFSAFGRIRKLDAAEDNVIGMNVDEDGEEIVSDLHCVIVVYLKNTKISMMPGRSFVAFTAKARITLGG